MSRASLCDPFTPFQSPTAQDSPASVPSLLHPRNALDMSAMDAHPTLSLSDRALPSPLSATHTRQMSSLSMATFATSQSYYPSEPLLRNADQQEAHTRQLPHPGISYVWCLPILVSFVEILVLQRGGQTLLGKGLCSTDATLASVQRRAHVNHRWVITCLPHASTDALSQVLGRPIPLSDTSLPMLSIRIGHGGRWRSPSEYPLSYLYWLPGLLHSHY